MDADAYSSALELFENLQELAEKKSRAKDTYHLRDVHKSE